ncbi:MAG: helix-turn-helix domain-containing protein [Candidatus Eremiobacter antarcticus]
MVANRGFQDVDSRRSRSQERRIASPEPLAVTVPKACCLLGVKATTVYKLMRSRQLSFVKIGRCTRIEHKAILAYLDRQRIGNRAS